MTRNQEKAAFEAAIKDNRYDQATRLVYADWLDENGFDEEAGRQRAWTPEWQAAVDHLTEVGKALELDYEETLQAALEFLTIGRRHVLDFEPPGFDTVSEREAFWNAVWTITGRRPQDHNGWPWLSRPFSCAC
jgi:uncharacterized protein (TIGR02996 family)